MDIEESYLDYKNLDLILVLDQDFWVPQLCKVTNLSSNTVHICY